MKQDLLPESYRQAQGSRRALRVWLAALSVCGVVSGVAVVSSALRNAPVQHAGVEEQIAVAERRADASQARATELGESLALHRRAVSAVDAVSEQPDWRVLIEHISAELGDQAVLTRCRLGALDGADARRVVDGDAAGAVWLVLGGVAADYAQVPAFVLRLEAMGLFTQVHLVETGRQTFAGESRIGFRIACRVQ